MNLIDIFFFQLDADCIKDQNPFRSFWVVGPPDSESFETFNESRAISRHRLAISSAFHAAVISFKGIFPPNSFGRMSTPRRSRSFSSSDKVAILDLILWLRKDLANSKTAHMAKGKFMMLIDRWRIGRFLSQLVNIVAASVNERTYWKNFMIIFPYS